MELAVTIKIETIQKVKGWFSFLSPEQWLLVISVIISVLVTTWSAIHGYTVAYGDSESHLNIAKRVIDSLTPGFAQLGGIWLPMPHLLMVPFVYFDFLWRTGLAGSIVSGIAFIISTRYIYKLTYLVTQNKTAAFIAGIVLVSNPNLLYMQSTPMTETLLIMFFLLSSFYFVKFLKEDKNILWLLLAGIFGFCATMSRYDGWFLVAAEAGLLFLYYLPIKFSLPSRGESLKKYIKRVFQRYRWLLMEGKLIMFCTIAFFGILLWFIWGYLILGDPLYFSSSEYSARAQQLEWHRKGELPAYHNPALAFLYYFVTAMSNVGVFIYAAAIVGLVSFLNIREDKKNWLIAIVLLVPFIFNVTTLFLGQSVIFIKHLTPYTFDWTLFNVRYGIMMVPPAAFFIGWLFSKSTINGKLLLGGLMFAQLGLYYVGYSKVITFEDGVRGLSSAVAKIPDVQGWINTNYDSGLVLVDDYARTMSIIRTNIPMNRIIYVGNRGYWDDSFIAPEKYATWIIMQKNDALWTKLYENPAMQGRVYKYFNKVYTSPEVLVFKRTEKPIEPADEIPTTVPKEYR